MKKFNLILFIASFTALFSISIYDIQYTIDPGANGTYPSLYEGQVVTTGGIVTGIDFDGGNFYISSSSGGAWSGIYVYDDDQNVAVGDSVIIEAEVYEYWGFTELSYLNYCNIISSGNPLPDYVNASTNYIFTQEEYESVLVQIDDVVVTQAYDEWSEWHVSDGSGSCFISTGFVNYEEMNIPMILGYPFSSITGIVSFGWDDFRLNPRNINELSSADDNYIISIPDQYIFSPAEFEVPFLLTFLGDIQQAESYEFELEFNPVVLQYSGFETTGTLSSGGTITIDQPASGILSAVFSGNFEFNQVQTLLKLNFTGLESGTTPMNFTDFNIDNVEIDFFSVGDIILQMQSTPIGDTLTVIQKPILNIPAIVSSGEELQIECQAAASTTGWNASLQHNSINIDLNISNSVYNSDLDRWLLTTEIPVPEIYELYDLVVSADGIETDISKNAVQIIPQFKDNYYFVHITDTHLPTHIFYPDPLSLTDSTEVEDLREVIRDINLIHPEFVLLTGDMVNEGEMEDFENRRVYTKAQKILEELEVPLYLTSGNHDLGGWDSSPPSQGTARRDWWRFFGWSWLQDPPATNPYYTQNYSFDYGPIHYIGMEAYLNYDSYMYNIFGGESFTSGQLQWLNEDLAQSSNSVSKVIFYHYDFSDQINLTNLGIDMALYGHNHSNTGNLTNPPFNISTKSTCDGNRSYRVINVDDATLQPSETIYAGWDGNSLQTTFTPENNGTADSVYCYVENSQYLNFPDAQLKFIMPAGAEEYTAFNGTLIQIDDSGEFAVCYVSFEIPANENLSISVVADYNVSSDNLLENNGIELTNYPNPFNPITTISFTLDTELTEKTKLTIYNLKGQKIKTFSNLQITQSLNHQIIWDGTDDKGIRVSSGIYFVTLRNDKFEITKKIMLLK